MEPLRYIIRHKQAAVKYYEAEATHIDHTRRVVKLSDLSDIKGELSETEIPFDYLVVGVGAENATFGMGFRSQVTYNGLTGRGKTRYSWCEGTCMLSQRDYRCSENSDQGHGLH